MNNSEAGVCSTGSGVRASIMGFRVSAAMYSGTAGRLTKFSEVSLSPSTAAKAASFAALKTAEYGAGFIEGSDSVSVNQLLSAAELHEPRQKWSAAKSENSEP
jgi:hypothetical protein